MSWDESLFRAINGLAGRSAVADEIFLHLSNSATLYLPAAGAAAFWLWRRRWEALLGAPFLAGTIGLADFVGGQLKWVFERVRPCNAMTDAIVVGGGACGRLFSFPSNHAMNTAAAAAFLHVLYPRTAWVSWPIVGLVGFARVFLGAHYVTDVVGGWLFGGVVGGGIAWALLQWPRFRRRSDGLHPTAAAVQKPS